MRGVPALIIIIISSSSIIRVSAKSSNIILLYILRNNAVIILVTMPHFLGLSLHRRFCTNDNIGGMYMKVACNISSGVHVQGLLTAVFKVS